MITTGGNNIGEFALGHIEFEKIWDKKSKIKWCRRSVNPQEPGYYYIKNHCGTVGIRYYDDSEGGGSWWLPTGASGFVPNDSFVEYLLISEIHK